MDFPSEMTDMLTFPMVAGMITWLVTQILGILFMIKFSPHKKNRKIDEAIRRGHVVTAYSNGKWDGHNSLLNTGKRHSSFTCEYVYKVDGKEMTYVYTGQTFPPGVIKLYYVDNPKKVIPGMDMSTWARDMAGLRFALVYILPFVFGALVMNALGGI